MRCKEGNCPARAISEPDFSKPTIQTIGDGLRASTGTPIHPPKSLGLCYYHYKKKKGLYDEKNTRFCGKASGPTIVGPGGKTRVLGPDWK